MVLVDKDKPLALTTGAMRSLLEQHGVYTRGKIADREREKLKNLLRELGYKMAEDSSDRKDGDR